MKRHQKYPKTFQKKTQNTQKNPNLNKKTTDITENNLTLLNYFEVSKSLVKIPSTNPPPSKGRQDKKKLKKYDRTDAKKDITITKFLKNKIAKDNEKKNKYKKTS